MKIYQYEIHEKGNYKYGSETKSENELLLKIAEHLRGNDEVKKIVIKVKEIK
jgi:hypothetical protein